ncbi:kinase-regulated stress-responsive transcription factor skn7 [Dinochytrium kinnereticum]|nr:kinase-regulated stress-responsive transcription factor skn7 [Dinochytrium kinnereticum]
MRVLSQQESGFGRDRVPSDAYAQQHQQYSASNHLNSAQQQQHQHYKQQHGHFSSAGGYSEPHYPSVVTGQLSHPTQQHREPMIDPLGTLAMASAAAAPAADSGRKTKRRRSLVPGEEVPHMRSKLMQEADDLHSRQAKRLHSGTDEREESPGRRKRVVTASGTLGGREDDIGVGSPPLATVAFSVTASAGVPAEPPIESMTLNQSPPAPQSKASTTSRSQKRFNGPPDFVKKLFGMLEDDSFSSTLAWGVNGDSFVVKEPSDFAKTILPRHFKHNNFASFVRQLNKYDFHKVKSSEGYGEQAWEFRHPFFRMDQLGLLENIRRKTAKKPLGGGKKVAPESDIEVSPRTTQLTGVTLPSGAPSNLGPGAETQPSGGASSFSMPFDGLKSINLPPRTDSSSTNLSTQQPQLQPTPTKLSRATQDPVSIRPPMKTSTTPPPMAQPPSNSIDMGAIKELQATVDTLMRLHGKTAGHLDGLNKQNVLMWNEVMQLRKIVAQQQREIERLEKRGSGAERGVQQQHVEEIRGGYAGFTADRVLTAPQQHLHHAQAPQELYMEQIIGSDEPAKVGDRMELNDQDEIQQQLVRQQQQHEQNQNQPTHQQQMQQQYQDMSSLVIPLSQPFHFTSQDLVASQPLRILIVDDNEIVRKISSHFLKRLDCNFDVAVDGINALDLLGSNTYDLILMDIYMPRLSGIEATRSIRQRDAVTPIISMTSDPSESDRIVFFKVGMTDTLSKPFNRDALQSIIERYCHRTLGKTGGSSAIIRSSTSSISIDPLVLPLGGRITEIPDDGEMIVPGVTQDSKPNGSISDSRNFSSREGKDHKGMAVFRMDGSGFGTFDNVSNRHSGGMIETSIEVDGVPAQPMLLRSQNLEQNPISQRFVRLQNQSQNSGSDPTLPSLDMAFSPGSADLLEQFLSGGSATPIPRLDPAMSQDAVEPTNGSTDGTGLNGIFDGMLFSGMWAELNVNRVVSVRGASLGAIGKAPPLGSEGDEVDGGPVERGDKRIIPGDALLKSKESVTLRFPVKSQILGAAAEGVRPPTTFDIEVMALVQLCGGVIVSARISDIRAELVPVASFAMPASMLP